MSHPSTFSSCHPVPKKEIQRFLSTDMLHSALLPMHFLPLHSFGNLYKENGCLLGFYLLCSQQQHCAVDSDMLTKDKSLKNDPTYLVQPQFQTEHICRLLYTSATILVRLFFTQAQVNGAPRQWHLPFSFNVYWL